MNDKVLNTRIISKHDTRENWDKAINFIPLEGELILYTDERKFKVGDGETSVINLPYFNENETPIVLMMEVTYNELVELRNSSLLIPGCLYRMIDYETIIKGYYDIYERLIEQGITDEDELESLRQLNFAQTANHQFDIVLTALSDNILSEEGSVLPHEGDDYFQNNNLSAWKIKYCLDNNEQRFDWVCGQSIYTSFVDEDVDINMSNIRAIRTSKPIPGLPDGGWWYNGYLNCYLYTVSITPRANSAVFVYWTADNPGEFHHKQVGQVNSYSPDVGKGVIYEMEDEFQNKISYDFKNIKFVRFGLIPNEGASEYFDGVFRYLSYERDDGLFGDISDYLYTTLYDYYSCCGLYDIDGAVFNYYYTFNGYGDYDSSLGCNQDGEIIPGRSVYRNTIGPLGPFVEWADWNISLGNKGMDLPNIVFFGDEISDNHIGLSAFLTFRDRAVSNKIYNVSNGRFGLQTTDIEITNVMDIIMENWNYNIKISPRYLEVVAFAAGITDVTVNNSVENQLIIAAEHIENIQCDNCGVIITNDSIEGAEGLIHVSRDIDGTSIVWWNGPFLSKKGNYYDAENDEWLPIPDNTIEIINE